MSQLKEWKFKFNKTYYEEIMNCIIDLYKINPMIKVKLDNETALFYSRAGTNDTIPAFKSFTYKIEDFIIADEYMNMDFIILNGSNFVKNCLLMMKKDVDIQGKLIYNEKAKVASQIYITNEKLNINFISGDYTQIKDITKQQIETRMDPTLSNFNFTVTGEQFKEIKKLVQLNKSEVINLRVKKSKVQFYDKRWSLDVAIVGPTIEDEIWTFNNKYLKSISPDEETGDVNVNMFDQFLLIKEGNTHLLIGLELTDLK